MLVDSHCHLDFPDFAAELPAVLTRARAAGVGHFLTIGTRLRTFGDILAIARMSDEIHCTVGIHPHDAAAEPLSGPDMLLSHASDAKTAGFGETGLDFYYNRSPRDTQIANFRAHIAAARIAGLPLVMHSRDAEEETITILREEIKNGPFTGVIHCFTGSDWFAREALALGFYISASGIATFKKAETLRAVFREVPLDRLLVETDAPYLAPEPYRGKRNEPAYVAATAAVLADVKGVTPEAFAEATTTNFFRLFDKAVP